MGSMVESSASDPHILISAVIFDLDGTLLNTEEVTKNILKDFLAKYGRVQDNEKEKKRMGMTFKESTLTILKDYDLPLTPEEYVQEILPMYQGTWLLAKPLPGANRLMRHLHKHGVPFALASNSLRKNIEGKISQQDGWKDNFSVILGSDQVKSGKPAPDLFLEAAEGMGVDSSRCLVFEDSIVGVKAGKAAKMNVVAVPSLQNEFDSYSIADSILHSLLEFQPEQWGLPQFDDCTLSCFLRIVCIHPLCSFSELMIVGVGNALPIEPILLTGLLSNGFFQAYADNGLSDLSCQTWGLYIGWAKIDGQVLKAVISIGWKLSCCGSERIIKPCLVDGSHIKKHDHRMQLLLVAYLRRSCNVGNVLYSPEIIDEDKVTADAALNLPAVEA